MFGEEHGDLLTPIVRHFRVRWHGNRANPNVNQVSGNKISLSHIFFSECLINACVNGCPLIPSEISLIPSEISV